MPAAFTQTPHGPTRSPTRGTHVRRARSVGSRRAGSYANAAKTVSAVRLYRPGGTRTRRIATVPQGTQPAPGHRLVERKVVAAEHPHVLPRQRRHPGEILVGHLLTVGTQTPDRLVEVQAVEQANGVHHQPQGAELVLLSFPVALPYLTPLAVEDLAGELVALLVAVELDEYPPAVRLIVHVGEQRKALCDAPHLRYRGGDGRGARAGLEGADELGSRYRAELKEPATRNNSSQFSRISPTLILLREIPFKGP